jgi:hypothetical protein
MVIVSMLSLLITLLTATLVAALGPIAVPVPNHEWDFRGCTTNSVIADMYEFTTATSYNTVCSSAGMVFSAGSNVLLTNMTWSGSTSFEVYVKPTSLTAGSRVFEFSDGSTTVGGSNLNAVIIKDNSALGASYEVLPCA